MGRKKYILKICTDKSFLSERANEVDIRNNYLKVEELIKELKNALYDYDKITVLAAPQLSHPDRIFCMKFAGGDVRTFINPMIMKSKGLHLSREICPSVPNKEFIVPRNDEIEVAYQTPTGKSESNLFKGAPAEMFQQMVNLLDGLMIDDFGLEILPGFDELSDDDKSSIINMYIDSLKLNNDKIKEEIESTPKLKEINDAISFYTSVSLGETKLEEFTIKKEPEEGEAVESGD